MSNADNNCPHGLTWSTCATCMFEESPPQSARSVPKAGSSSRRTTSPKSAEDKIEALHGTKDLSFPVYDFVTYYEERTDWLLGETGYPHDLRSGGWVYLRHDGALHARVRARRVAWRDARPYRTGATPEASGAGPGIVIEVHPDTWESFHLNLGDLADSHRQGYRYLLTTIDDEVVHLTVDAAIPDVELSPAFVETDLP